ncbi:MAG TPA: hypothetical protein VF144_07875, partial [Chitinophagaceae bacterium]
MKRYSATNFFLLVSLIAFGTGGEYAVTGIPDALKKNANVVKRTEEERFILKSPGEAVYYCKYALTILNENGDKHAAFQQYYDKFIEIKNIQGTLFDAAGTKIKELKNKDIQDH